MTTTMNIEFRLPDDAGLAFTAATDWGATWSGTAAQVAVARAALPAWASVTDANVTNPLTAALTAAMTALDEAEQAYFGHRTEQPDDVPESPEWSETEDRLESALDDARAAYEAARAALADSDEPREWVCSDDGTAGFQTLTAASGAAAAEMAADSYDRDDYPADARTIYIDGWVECAATGERESYHVTLPRPEPRCDDGHEHDWRSPYSVLGGLRDNPGVWGHGGGVITREVCAHCGLYRVTDTWAQRRDTGEQGLTEVSYEDADDASREWVAARRLMAAA